jgi:hypothetical protein
MATFAAQRPAFLCGEGRVDATQAEDAAKRGGYDGFEGLAT